MCWSVQLRSQRKLYSEKSQGKVPVLWRVSRGSLQHRLFPKYVTFGGMKFLRVWCTILNNRILVPEPKPECTVDADCPSRLACLNEVCRNPCTTLTPCGQNAECTVQNTLPQRTMVCMCIPGYVGDADIACNLRKIFCTSTIIDLLTFSGFISFLQDSRTNQKDNLMAYHTFFFSTWTNFILIYSTQTRAWL